MFGVSCLFDFLWNFPGEWWLRRLSYFSLLASDVSLYLCFYMGQPTSGLTQRAGRSQLWEHTLAVVTTEQGFAEQQARCMLGVRISTLFFQSLMLSGNTPVNLWYASTRSGYTFFRLHHVWGSTSVQFPLVRTLSVRSTYFETKPAVFFLFDGENRYMTLAYTHRRLRFNSVFWARPRVFRVDAWLLLSLRGYNVTEPRRVPVRSSRVVLRRLAPKLAASSLVVGGTHWF